jgi:hypothetical protein
MGLLLFSILLPLFVYGNDGCPTTPEDWEKLKVMALRGAGEDDGKLAFHWESNAKKCISNYKLPCTENMRRSLFLETKNGNFSDDALPEKLRSTTWEKWLINRQGKAGLEDTEQFIKKAYPQAQILTFKSTVVVDNDIIDNLAQVALIQLPGYDHWIHTALEEGNRKAVIGLRIATSGIKKFRPLPIDFTGIVYMPDFEKKVLRFKDIDGGVRNCMGCHRTGAILPNVDPSFKYSKPTLELMRKRIIETSQIDDSRTPLKDFGPRLGDWNEQKNEELFDRCVPVGVNVKKVQGAFNCTACHDDADTGSISFPIGVGADDGSSHISKRLLDQLILTGRMPPGSKAGGINDLSAEERKALLGCLVDSYYRGFGEHMGAPDGSYVRYLLGENCVEGQPPSTTKMTHLKPKSVKKLPVSYHGISLDRLIRKK